ncbi:PKD domain [Chryseobacterium taklimakanense]|uniref:PKD domain n=1 Tax=Chryseobacterium taklimakanense TaxID=536441 RepID=A0A239WM95_9FLAO|nr:PKD domain-containing protein [Chryseobacterium taklimakanense]SNV34724.1 PKD domain [Chryseobacterium taklimakanense]
MNYVQKNRRNILLISAGVVLLVALILLATQKKEFSSDDIVATVYPISLNVGDTLKFEDNSPFGKSHKWVFSDGYQSLNKKGHHAFAKAGFYPVTLFIDDKYNKTFNVVVSGAGQIVQEKLRQPTIIDAPTQAMQFSNVFFRAETTDAKMFTWKFGESGGVDARTQMASYAFKTPGRYIVTLITDTDQEPVIHHINILPAYPEIEEVVAPPPPPPTEAEVFSKINDDFRYHLQQIANGNNFNYHYNYLKNTYLCGKNNVSVAANDKNNSFYNYCMGLQFDKNNLIQEVKTTVDTGQNCVTKVEVKQSKQ